MTNKSKIEIGLLVIALPFFALTLRHSQGVYYHRQAILAQERKSYAEAIVLYRKSLAIGPSAAMVHYNLATAYDATRDYDKAILEFQAALKFKSDYLQAFLGLSQDYAVKQNYLKALATLAKAQSIFANEERVKSSVAAVKAEYATNCLNEGVDAYLSGDREKAYQLLEIAIANRPDQAMFYYTAAYFYYKDGDRENARINAVRALELNPGFWLSRKLLGDIYFELGAFDAAVQEYKTALADEPQDATLNNDLGLAYMQIEDYPQAVVYLQKALDLDPENPNISYSLASVYRDNRDFPAAIAKYSELVSRFPDYLFVHNDLGDIYRQSGLLQSAQEEYRKELQYCRQKLASGPQAVEIMNSLAYAYQGLKDYPKAEEILNMVFNQDPFFRPAYLTLAVIQEETGRYSQSLVTLAKAKTLPGAKNYIDRSQSRITKDYNVIPGVFRGSYQVKVYLTNGRMLQGWIVEETPEKTVVELLLAGSTGRVTVYSKDILRIERGR
jgi:tetratricopeptide (TPR) repeat protein